MRKGAPTIDQGVVPPQAAKHGSRHGKGIRGKKNKKHGKKGMY